jgi:hypothetical protein
VGTGNSPPFCVEFGFSSHRLTGGTGANVARLIVEQQWRSRLFDRDHENPEINLHRERLDAGNIGTIFRRHGVPPQPDYVSIDVDSTDLWLFEALLREFPARVFSVEYNSHFPLEAAITFPNDPAERWENDRGYGASLKALNLVARKHGYSLLWVVPRLDAFFIRNDLIDDGSDQICFPFAQWRNCTGLTFHPPLRDSARAGIFLDYEILGKPGGNIAAARLGARARCRRYLGWKYPTLYDLAKGLVPAGIKRMVRRMTAKWVSGGN